MCTPCCFVLFLIQLPRCFRDTSSQELCVFFWGLISLFSLFHIYLFSISVDQTIAVSTHKQVTYQNTLCVSLFAFISMCPNKPLNCVWLFVWAGVLVSSRWMENKTHQRMQLVLFLLHFVKLSRYIHTQGTCDTQTLLGLQTFPFPRTCRKVLLCVSAETRQRGSRN